MYKNKAPGFLVCVWAMKRMSKNQPRQLLESCEKKLFQIQANISSFFDPDFLAHKWKWFHAPYS